MTTYHLVSSPTVIATLAAARRVANMARPIRIEASGTPEECYAAFISTFTNTSVNATLEEIVKSNLTMPVAVTPSTTYHIVADKSTEETRSPTSDNEKESRKWLRDSALRSAREAVELIVKRRESELLEAKRSLERFDEAVELSKKPKAERPSWYSRPSYVLSNVAHSAAQAGNNDRLDMLVTRAAELAAVEAWEA